MATVVVVVEASDNVVAAVVKVVLGELVGDDDETGAVVGTGIDVDDETVDATIADVVSEAPSDPPLHDASAANIVAAEAAAFHALLMATPPSGGC